MAIVGALSLVAPAPVPDLVAGVRSRASRSFHHVSGAVRGARVVYADLNACAWYQGGNWESRGPRVMARIMGLKGGEDAKQFKRQ